MGAGPGARGLGPKEKVLTGESPLVCDPSPTPQIPGPLSSAAQSLGRDRIHVMAGALFDRLGRVLIAQRPAGKHMAGGWEFPGGKLIEGESRFDGLRRELKEEIGVEVIAATPLICYEHQFADRRVLLDLWCVSEFTGTPQSLEGQPLKFVEVDELERVGLLEADRPMIAALKRLEGYGL